MRARTQRKAWRRFTLRAMRDIVRSVFGDVKLGFVDYIMWNGTGYPYFFMSRTHEGKLDEFEGQVARAKRWLDAGHSLDDEAWIMHGGRHA